MIQISPDERYWIESVASGPFSFRLRYEGGQYTTAGEQTFCASTYNAMMARGWVEDLNG